MIQIEIIPALEYALRNIASKESQVVAFDIYGQAFIPQGMIMFNSKVYDAKDFNFNVEEFLKGQEVTLRSGEKIRVLPTEIKYVIELPSPEQINEFDTEG